MSITVRESSEVSATRIVIECDDGIAIVADDIESILVEIAVDHTIERTDLRAKKWC